MEINKVCPICGCEEIGKGKQYNQARMYPIDKVSTGSETISEICTQCGYVLSTKVVHPERFK